MVARIDLTGQRFTRLLVKEYAGKKKWLCVCDCGTERVVAGDNLRLGRTKSCGCFKVDYLAARSAAPTTWTKEKVTEYNKQWARDNKERRNALTRARYAAEKKEKEPD